MYYKHRIYVSRFFKRDNIYNWLLTVQVMVFLPACFLCQIMGLQSFPHTCPQELDTNKTVIVPGYGGVLRSRSLYVASFTSNSSVIATIALLWYYLFNKNYLPCPLRSLMLVLSTSRTSRCVGNKTVFCGISLFFNNFSWVTI